MRLKDRTTARLFRLAPSTLLLLLLASTTALLSTFAQAQTDGWLNITIVHTNDIHSRVDPANALGVACTDADIAAGNCFGGFARHKTLIQQLRQAKKDSLLLDGGDEFQGTLFYSYYKGNVTSDIMNELGYDATTVGNHEWDDGPDTVGRYWAKLKMPVVCCNIDFSKNPELGKLVKPYTIIEKYGIGVIGYITPTTGEISAAGNTVSFVDPVAPIQKAIDELTAKGIKRIIAVSHHGYGPDMEVAAKTRGLDLIVGGHSHSYLGDPQNPLYQGPYPTLIKDLDGQDTLIVQAYCWGRFIGNLDISFNPEGKIVAWAGAPVQVEYTIPGEPALLKQVDVWRSEFEAWSKKVLGHAADNFDLKGCSERDCYMGNFFNDAMLAAARKTALSKSKGRKSRPWPDFSFCNTGGIRSGIPKGNVTVEHVVTTSPFGNYMVQLPMTGKEILAMLEDVVAGKNTVTGKDVTSFIQVAGLRFTYDSAPRPAPVNGTNATIPTKSRILKAQIRDRRKKWRKIVPRQRYNVVTMDFVMTGGDNILVKKPRPEALTLERMDNMLMAEVERKKRISPYVDGRIRDVVPPVTRNSDEISIVDLKSFQVNPLGWPPGTPGYLRREFPQGPEQMHRVYAHLRR